MNRGVAKNMGGPAIGPFKQVHVILLAYKDLKTIENSIGILLDWVVDTTCSSYNY